VSSRHLIGSSWLLGNFNGPSANAPVVVRQIIAPSRLATTTPPDAFANSRPVCMPTNAPQTGMVPPRARPSLWERLNGFAALARGIAMRVKDRNRLSATFQQEARQLTPAMNTLPLPP